MENIYTKMNHIAENGYVKQELKDIELSKHLEQIYGIDVLCSEFTFAEDPFGQIQGSFTFMVDTKKSSNDVMKSLNSLIGTGNYGAQISLPSFGECFREFAKVAVTEYLKIVGLNRKDYDEMHVTVFEFRAKTINYLYGKAFREVQDSMYGKIIIDKRDIIGMEDSKYYFLIDNLDDFIYAINNRENIYKMIFEVMKKYDHYDLLNYNEIKISFFLKQALDFEMLSEFLQRRTL